MQRKNSSMQGYSQAEIAAEAIFKHYDIDKNGVLDSEEVFAFIREILQLDENQGQISAELLHSKMFKLGDENHDNRLSMR